MFLRRFLSDFFRDRDLLSAARRRPSSKRKTGRSLRLEPLEDRVLPTLLGVLAVSVPPDITSGGVTKIASTQVGNQYQFALTSQALAITLGDNSVHIIKKPTVGTATETLNINLDSMGAFASGTPADFTVTGSVTLGSNTFNGTLLTAEVRAFGFSNPQPALTKFDVLLVVTGGLLAQQPLGIFRVGYEVGLILNVPGLLISSFPKTFTLTTTSASDDLRKIRDGSNDQQLPNEPLGPGQQGESSCGCGVGNSQANGLPTTNANNSVDLPDLEAEQQSTLIDIPGRNGLDFEIQSAYRSDITNAGPLGQNWDYTYDRRLMVATADDLAEVRTTFASAKIGDVMLLDGTDRFELYVLNPDGAYASPTGLFIVLTLNPNGTYTERDYTGDTVQYTKPEADGTCQMTMFQDRQEDSLQFQYNTLGELTTVTDPLGRPSQFTYNSQGLLTDVTDYTGSGRPVPVRHPGRPGGRNHSSRHRDTRRQRFSQRQDDSLHLCHRV